MVEAKKVPEPPKDEKPKIEEPKIESPEPKTPEQREAPMLGNPYSQYPINEPINPHNPVPWPPGYNAPPPPPDIITFLNYTFERKGGMPPQGFCYWTMGNAPNITFSYKSADTDDNMDVFQSLVVGDTISANDVTLTITAINYQGSAIQMAVNPNTIPLPYGMTTFMFDHVVSRKAREATGGRK